MGLLGSIAAPIVGAVAGGLFNSGSSGGGGDSRVVNVSEPWAGIQPYLVGSDPGLAYTEPKRPISQDWLAWNKYMSEGLPVGPEPPMFVDDPRYTGEGVYDAPFTYYEPKQNLAYGDPHSEYGALPGGFGTVNPNPYGDATDIYGAAPGLLGPGEGAAAPQYPSQDRPQNVQVTPQAPPQATEQAGTSFRYSPWLKRMVAVDDQGQVAEDIDAIIAEASVTSPARGEAGGWHINPRTGELVGNYAYGAVGLWDTDPTQFFHKNTGGMD